MGEMADELALQEYNLTHLPETHRRNGFGKYTYVETHSNGAQTKHYFQTVEAANKWAKKRGFLLSTKPPKSKVREEL